MQSVNSQGPTPGLRHCLLENHPYVNVLMVVEARVHKHGENMHAPVRSSSRANDLLTERCLPAGPYLMFAKDMHSLLRANCVLYLFSFTQ